MHETATTPVDLDKAMQVIRQDKTLRREFARLGDAREQAAYLLRAARVAGEVRLGEDGDGPV